MKSVTIRDAHGNLLIKIIERKNGTYDLFKSNGCEYVQVEARDNSNHKIMWDDGK